MKPLAIFKTCVAALASYYCIWYISTPNQAHVIDAFDLLMHEAGHWIFSPFGWFLYTLGGSLMQILVPLLFIAYFWRRGEKFSASLLLFWLGINFINVSLYAADALRMELPLLGGNENVTHDWNALLLYSGQLHHAASIALAIKLSGLIILASGAYFSFRYAASREDFKQLI